MSNKIVVKLYDKLEAFKTTLSGSLIASKPIYTEALGYGNQQMSFRYAVNFDDSTIEHYDIITVEDTSGAILYRGVVNSLSRRLENNGESIIVSCMGMLSLGKKTIFKSGTNYSFSKNADPRDIIEDIIDHINSKYATNPFSYVNNTTTIARGTTINIDFDYTDCVDAIKKIVELTDYVFRISGEGVVYFTPATSTYVASHTLTMGRHIESLEIDEKSNRLYNDYILEYSGGGTQTGNDATSITAYGTLTEYLFDSTANDAATATERIDAELAKYKAPNLNTMIIVNDNYPIETLKVGDLITISNMNYSISNKVIQKITYSVTEVILYIDSYESIAKSLQEIT